MSAFRSRHVLLETRVRRFTRMFPGVNGGDLRAIHGTRVASRRLREVVPVLQLDGAVAKRLTRKLKKLTRRLGRLRELDVLGLLLEELQQSGRFSARGLKLISADVASERRAYLESMTDAGFDAELRRVSRKLERALDRLPSDRDDPDDSRAVRWAVDARVARRAALLKDRIEQAGNVYLVERLHAVRIAVKKLRYGVEVAQELAGQRRSPDGRLLKREQELLGRLHDLQMVIDRVRRVQGSLTPPDLVVWRDLDAVIRGLETSCRRLHASYMHDRPALLQLCDRLQSHAAVERRGRSRRAG
jgi:CHAD domain-containing protein